MTKSIRVRRATGRASLSAQGGFGILSALLALVIGSVVTAGVIEGHATEAQLRAGRLQGDILNLWKDAGNNYAMENYPALQNNVAVTKNGVTIPPGQILQPSTAELIAMGYLPANTAAAAQTGGNYQVRLRREPAACVTTACNITGEVFIDQAIVRPGTAEMNGVIVGAIMDRVGGDVMVALNTNAAQLQSPAGATVNNPVGGNPAGVVAARVGFGASGFGRFLVLNDPRDPNFQGNLTVAGTVSGSDVVGSNSVGAGTLAGCLRSVLQSDGNIFARSAGCINTAWLDGTNGRVNAANAAGVVTARLDGQAGTVSTVDPATGLARAILFSDGQIQSRNAMGVATMTIDAAGRIGSTGVAANSLPPGWTGGLSTNDVAARLNVGAWDGTRVRAQMSSSGAITSFDATGAALGGIDTTGRVSAQVVRANSSGTGGASCAGRASGDIATAASGVGLVMCDGAVWVAVSLQQASVGGACTVTGSMAVTSSGTALICSGGTWMSMTDRMGRWAMAGTYLVGNGSGLGKPACGSGGTAKIYLSAQSINAEKLYISYRALDYGGYWIVIIHDGQGGGVGGATAIAELGCWYS